MHRVIALNGVPETAAAVHKPKSANIDRDIDLSRTMHEWGIQQQLASASAPQLAESTESAELAVSAVSPSPSQPADNSKASAEAHWATHSSISLEIFEETPLPPRILNINVEDAVTQQYNPATTGLAFGLPSSDLANLDRALESAGALDDDDHEFGVITNYQPTTTPEPAIARAAQPPSQELQTPPPPQPRMLLVPASIVWTLLTVCLLCVLALTGMIVAAVLRGRLF